LNHIWIGDGLQNTRLLRRHVRMATCDVRPTFSDKPDGNSILRPYDQHILKMCSRSNNGRALILFIGAIFGIIIA
jgi:hypothetical protein